MIEVNNLTKLFGERIAVDHISFAVKRGEILGFLGPNGAGKTTTMRMLTGFLPATRGTASVAGFDVSNNSLEVRRRIGYLPQLPPLYPDMVVESYLDFVARIKHVPPTERKRRITDVLERTQIADKRRERIHKLSHGYRQRVGLAQALVHNPEVLILDEPSNGLDPKQIIEFRRLIKGLGGAATIILSTHILPEVSMTCDRVVIINHGKIAAMDTPENLAAQIKGGQCVRVESEGDPNVLRTAMMQISGVRRVVVEPCAKGEGLAITIDSEPGRDVRRAIGAIFAANGWPLLELRTVNVSLEEIFVQLTKEDSPEMLETTR